MTNKSESEFNSDLEKISYWVYQWKMLFNPKPNKQANKTVLSKTKLK